MTAPTGTIAFDKFDGLDRLASAWVRTSTGNLVDTADNVYDNNGVGDSNLTLATAHATPGNAAGDGVTQNLFDFQDRLVATKRGVLMSGGPPNPPNPSGETDGVHRPIVYTVLDNLGEVTRTYQYDGDTISLSDFATSANADAVPTADSNKVRSATIDNYDEQGRVYASAQLDVNQSTGFSGLTDSQILALPQLTVNMFFDHRGNIIETASPGGFGGLTAGGLVHKSQFDGAGRDVKDSTTDGGVLAGASANWANAATTTNDVVLAQTLRTYDANDNPILTKRRDRLPTDATTGSSAIGDLIGPSGTGPNSRDSFAADYYDAADRRTDSVDVGTNGGSAYTRPSSVPTGSDSVLVHHTDYNPAGDVLDTIDPRGIVTQYGYDLLGQTIKTIADFSDGTPTASTNQTTTYTYDGNGNLLSETAVMPSGTPNQTTAYIYGTSSTSGVYSNDLLAKIEYPDKTSGSASTSAADDVSFTFDALGDAVSRTDQNGTTHALKYDVLGREVSDSITTLGTAVDGSILCLGYSFNGQGLAYQQTSYSNAAGTTIVNQVQDSYNGFGQIIGEYQAHGGAVNTSTTPQVQYAYTEAVSGNNSRLTSMTYPNGRVLNDNYNSGIDATISRVSNEADAAGSAAGSLQTYTYLGVGTVIGGILGEY